MHVILSTLQGSAVYLTLLLMVDCAGCGGGFVYRPDPEPRQEFPVDISVEQEIYAATATKPLKAEPVVEPEQTQKAAPVAPSQPTDYFYSVHLFSFKRPDFAHSAAQKTAAQTDRGSRQHCPAPTGQNRGLPPQLPVYRPAGGAAWHAAVCQYPRA